MLKYKNVFKFKNHKRYMDKAIESVVNKAHKELKAEYGYSIASTREKEIMLEEKITAILTSKATPELVSLYTFLQKNGDEAEYDTLVSNVKSEFENNINPERIEDVEKKLNIGRDVVRESGSEHGLANEQETVTEEEEERNNSNTFAIVRK